MLTSYMFVKILSEGIYLQNSQLIALKVLHDYF